MIDTVEGTPISGAELHMVYEGPNGETVKEGPFYTDSKGHAVIAVEKKAIWMKGTDAYFVGGYLRHIEVKMRGYQPTGYWEGFNKGLLEKKTPFTFKMTPLRNQFGAVRVLAQEVTDELGGRTLTLEVLNGPQTGDVVIISVFFTRRVPNPKGTKLYLRKSLPEILTKSQSGVKTAYNFDEVLREGLEDEPYRPE